MEFNRNCEKTSGAEYVHTQHRADILKLLSFNAPKDARKWQNLRIVFNKVDL